MDFVSDKGAARKRGETTSKKEKKEKKEKKSRRRRRKDRNLKRIEKEEEPCSAGKAAATRDQNKFVNTTHADAQSNDKLSLHGWLQKELEKCGVDDTFVPYIIDGVLEVDGDSDAVVNLDEEALAEKKESLQEMLMGIVEGSKGEAVSESSITSLCEELLERWLQHRKQQRDEAMVIQAKKKAMVSTQVEQQLAQLRLEKQELQAAKARKQAHLAAMTDEEREELERRRRIASNYEKEREREFEAEVQADLAKKEMGERPLKGVPLVGAAANRKKASDKVAAAKAELMKKHEHKLHLLERQKKIEAERKKKKADNQDRSKRKVSRFADKKNKYHGSRAR